MSPTAAERRTLVRRTGDDLAGPTPCTAYSVGDLLDQIEGLTLAFTSAAAKAHDAMARRPRPVTRRDSNRAGANG